MAWVFDNGPKDSAERLVLLALADYATDAGEWAPSMIGIAAKAGMTERGARGIIRRLEAAGWIDVEIGGGRGGKSRYRIRMDRGENTEQQTGNDKPGLAENPERGDAKPGTKRPETRNHVPPNHQNHLYPSEEPPLVPPSPKPRRKPEVPLPHDWVPSERNIADAKARQFSAQEIIDEADLFRNHHTSHDNRFRDWDAAWRTWLGKARKYRPRGGMAGQAATSGRGQGRSLASIVAERRLGARGG